MLNYEAYPDMLVTWRVGLGLLTKTHLIPVK